MDSDGGQLFIGVLGNERCIVIDRDVLVMVYEFSRVLFIYDVSYSPLHNNRRK